LSRVNKDLIAAAAIEQGYAILTENLRHFEKIQASMS
jgi:predicted nucleic acid-binding protein